MAGEFQAGSIVGKLTLDRTKWNAAVAGVKTQTKSMGNWVRQNSAQFRKMGLAITAVGAIAAVTFTKMVKKYVEVGDQIDKMVKRTGFSAEALSELAYAADISGADISLLEKGVKSMAKTISYASDDLETYLREFRKIGVSVDDLMKLNPEQQFLKIAEGISKLEHASLRSASAQVIFGRAGMMLLPLFAEGAEGMANLRKEAHRLGNVFDEAGAKRAADLKDRMTDLKGSLQGLGFAIVEDVVPVLTQMAEHFTDVFVNVRDNTKTFTEGILDFFGILVQGIGGLMMAWTGLKTGVFKISAYVAEQLEKFVYAIVAQLVVLEKIPIIGKKIVPITDAIWESLKSLTAIAKGYNDEGERQLNVLTNQVTFLENLKKALNDAKEGFKNLATESAITTEVLKTKLGPASTDVWDNLMKLGAVTEEVTEWTGENMKKMQEDQTAAFESWAMALQGGLAGVMSAIKQIVIGEFLKSLATSKLPFLAKLALTAVTIGVVEAAFASFMKGTQGRALGGRVEEGQPYTVGERGAELFVPERPGTIVPHGELGPVASPIIINISPVVNVSDQIDPYSSQRLVRDVILPETVNALENKYMLEKVRKALGIK